MTKQEKRKARPPFGILDVKIETYLGFGICRPASNASDVRAMSTTLRSHPYSGGESAVALFLTCNLRVGERNCHRYAATVPQIFVFCASARHVAPGIEQPRGAIP